MSRMQTFQEAGRMSEVCKRIGLGEGQLLEDIKKLELWMKEQNHLPRDAVDQYLLEKFVLAGKGDLEKSKRKLDTYFTVRNFLTDLFRERDPLLPQLLTNYDCINMSLLPGLTPDGARVLIISLASSDASMYELGPTMQRLFNMLDVWLRIDPHVNKIYIVADCKDANIGHMMKISISVIKNTVYCIQNVYPVSLCGIIYLNMIPVVGTVMEKVIKPLFKKKLAQRFVFCGKDCSGLNEKVPLAMLPRDYGGDAPTVGHLNQRWIDILKENRDWLMTCASTPSDETQREGECPYRSTGCSIM